MRRPRSQRAKRRKVTPRRPPAGGAIVRSERTQEREFGGLLAVGELLAVSLNGVLQPDPARAVVPVTDRGLLLGDAVFETLRSWRGRLPFLPQHLRRLRASADALSLQLPPDEQLAQELGALLAGAGGGDVRLRLQVTRGDGPAGLDPGPGGTERRIGLASALSPPPTPRLAALVAAGRPATLRPSPTIKTSSYAPSISALLAARAAGAEEALRVDDDGRVLDAAAGNLFVVRDGALVTPPADGRLRAGVTRELLLSLAPACGLVVREAALPAAELSTWHEAFVCSSARGLAPLAAVLHAGGRHALLAPGPVTQALGVALTALARG